MSFYRSLMRPLLRGFHDIAQPPKSFWKPPLTQEDRDKLKTIYRTRVFKKIPKVDLPRQPEKQYSQETLECLAKIREQGLKEQKFYAVVDINTKPFNVTTNDVVITKRLPDSKVGDVLQLTNVKEIGSREHYIRGEPYIDAQFVDVKAVVLENTVSANYTKYLRRAGKGPGDRKWRKRRYRDNLSVLRIMTVEVPNVGK